LSVNNYSYLIKIKKLFGVLQLIIYIQNFEVEEFNNNNLSIIVLYGTKRKVDYVNNSHPVIIQIKVKELIINNSK